MTIVVASLVKTAEKDNIIQHTNSYHPSVSQYTQKNVPNHRYINPDLTVSDMHRESYNSSMFFKYVSSAWDVGAFSIPSHTLFYGFPPFSLVFIETFARRSGDILTSYGMNPFLGGRPLLFLTT